MQNAIIFKRKDDIEMLSPTKNNTAQQDGFDVDVRNEDLFDDGESGYAVDRTEDDSDDNDSRIDDEAFESAFDNDGDFDEDGLDSDADDFDNEDDYNDFDASDAD